MNAPTQWKRVPAKCDQILVAVNGGSTFARPNVGATIAAAALAVLIAIGLLGSVAGIFQRDGAPFEQLVVAERACANHSFVSERETCMRLHLAALRVRHIASR
ncbi:MAG: hypothetical protein ACM338_04760 [Betaproteobacteria bacterium]